MDLHHIKRKLLNINYLLTKSGYKRWLLVISTTFIALIPANSYSDVSFGDNAGAKVKVLKVEDLKRSNPNLTDDMLQNAEDANPTESIDFDKAAGVVRVNCDENIRDGSAEDATSEALVIAKICDDG